jgi:hypothetical protein
MDGPLIDPAWPIDLAARAADPHHRLNRGRTCWLLAAPPLDSGHTWWDISGGGNHSALNLGGGSAGGWKSDARPGGGRSLALSSAAADRLDPVRPGLPGAYITAAAATVAAWVRPTDAASSSANSYSLPMIWGDTVGGFFGLHWGTIGGAQNVWAYNWDGAERRVGGPYTQGRWVRALMVLGGGQLSLYLNGVPQGSVASGATSSYSGGPTVNAGIWVDDVATWNRPLSASEAWEDYAESIAGYPTALRRPSVAAPFAPPPAASYAYPPAGLSSGVVNSRRVVRGVARR